MAKTFALVALCLLSVGLLAGCGGSSGTANSPNATSSSPNEKTVSRADYGAKWPLKVESGTLRCDDPGAVTFTSNGTTYWVNGTAGDYGADDQGWKDIRPIWANDPDIPGLKISIGPLIDDGLALCN
jgi:Protein of unknown function (DUF2511)